MRRVLKWFGIAVASILVLAVAGVGVAFAVSNHRMNASWNVKAHPFTIPTDAASIAEGKRLYAARGCADCHGADLSGAKFIDDPGLGQWTGANLTTILPAYSEADWDRTVRQGVKPDGKSVFFMPANEFYYLSDHDLGAIVAYMKTMPKVDRPQPEQKVGVVARIVHALDLMALDPARKVDHNAPRPADLKPAVTAEFGERLAKGQCMTCHGEHLSGGPIPGAPPSLPVPKNITMDSTGLGTWTEAQFVTALRTGKRPDGSEINPFMPWRTFASLSEEELGALWIYLRSVPPKPFGQR
jgi:mono/diheme cytochrome c family protein